MNAIKTWWADNAISGIIAFGILMFCTLPTALSGNIKADTTMHHIADIELNKTKRYRSDVLLFNQDRRTVYFNCDMWFENNFCQKISDKIHVKTAQFQMINCTQKECSAIIHHGQFIQNQEVITYQANPNFIQNAVNYQLNINRVVLAVCLLSVVGFLMSVVSVARQLKR